MKISIKVDNKEVEQVQTFKYLGMKVNKDRPNEAEINDRLDSDTKLYFHE